MSFCDQSSTAWGALKNGLSLRYVRFVIPWDAVDTLSASNQCVYNQNASGQFNEVDDYGNSDIADLIRFAGAAKNAGLTVVVSLTSGQGIGPPGGPREPYWPDANSADGNASTGDYQYECGFYGLASAMRGWTVPVSFWEVYNEPDNNQSDTGTAIPWNVAANYYVDAYVTDHYYLGYTDYLIAGAFNYADIDPQYCCTYPIAYLVGVFDAIRTVGVPAPNAFSGHPYDDPTASGATDSNVKSSTQNLINSVNGITGSSFSGTPVWLTETGVYLHDPHSDGHGQTLGHDVNGSAINQAYGAQGFHNLATFSPQVQAVFWYEFETYGDGSNHGGDSWDSALLGITNTDWSHSGNYAPSANEYGVPRASFCVLAYGDGASPFGANPAEFDSRCDSPSSPHDPTTDWESP